METTMASLHQKELEGQIRHAFAHLVPPRVPREGRCDGATVRGLSAGRYETVHSSAWTEISRVEQGSTPSASARCASWGLVTGLGIVNYQAPAGPIPTMLDSKPIVDQKLEALIECCVVQPGRRGFTNPESR